nr:5990_t:CDS:2 [Entrophospora candida]
MLVNDMGGHGRALEALEIAIKEFSKLGLVQFMNDEGETDQGRFALSLHMDLDNGEQVR